MGGIMSRDRQGGVFVMYTDVLVTQLHGRRAAPRRAGGKGEEVTPGIRTKHYVGTYNGDDRDLWNHGRFGFS